MRCFGPRVFPTRLRKQRGHRPRLQKDGRQFYRTSWSQFHRLGEGESYPDVRTIVEFSNICRKTNVHGPGNVGIMFFAGAGNLRELVASNGDSLVADENLGEYESNAGLSTHSACSLHVDD